MTGSLVLVLMLVCLWCGWTCGRSHERYHHRDGSVYGFGGKWGGSGEDNQ